MADWMPREGPAIPPQPALNVTFPYFKPSGIDSCRAADGTFRYAPCTAGEHLMAKHFATVAGRLCYDALAVPKAAKNDTKDRPRAVDDQRGDGTGASPRL